MSKWVFFNTMVATFVFALPLGTVLAGGSIGVLGTGLGWLGGVGLVVQFFMSVRADERRNRWKKMYEGLYQEVFDRSYR